MFYIHSGCYSDFSVHACTEDEELAKLYCAIHNSRCGDSYDCYRYSDIDKLEDVYDIDKSLVNMFCSSEINIDIDNGQYVFNIKDTVISAKTDYRFEFNMDTKSDELVTKSNTEVKDGKDEYDNTLKRFNMTRRMKKGEDGEERITYRLTIENFITNSDDDKIILKSAEDYFYSMLALTDGVVDIDKWNAHEILTKGSKYKRFISIWFDIDSWDFTPETIDSISIEVYRDYIASIDQYNQYPSHIAHFEGYRSEVSLCINNVDDFYHKGFYFNDIEVKREFDTDEELYNFLIKKVKKIMIDNADILKKEFAKYDKNNNSIF